MTPDARLTQPRLSLPQVTASADRGSLSNSQGMCELVQVNYFCVPGDVGWGLWGQLDSLVVLCVSTRQVAFSIF